MQNQTQNQTQTREIKLSDGQLTQDIIEFNGFWAATPSQVRLIYEEEPSNGLWQLILYDLKSPRSWRIGSYLDGYEGRRTLYDMTLALYYGRYIDDSEEARKYDVTNDVIRESGGVFVINLPDEWRPDVVIRIPALCGASYPLAEPVYIGMVDNRYFALDCAAGLYEFATLDELETWIRERECPEGHEYPVIHWWEWHVVRGGEVVYSEYVQPSPQEVIDALRQNLRPT
jgi:hypothetical protein